MEMTFTKEYTLSAVDVDCFGRCKASVLLYLAQEAATGHCDILRLDWDTMAEKGLFWAVIRSHVKIRRLPVLGERVYIQTWPMPTTRTAFPRAVEILDSTGGVLVQIVSLWVLMDMMTRTMVLPGKSNVDVPGFLTGFEIASPNSLVPAGHNQRASRRVVFSELDRNGHLNNTRYMEWAADLLPAKYHKLNPVREFTICYLSEALEGQQIDMEFGLSEDDIFQVDGYRLQTDEHGKKTRVFSVKIKF